MYELLNGCFGPQVIPAEHRHGEADSPRVLTAERDGDGEGFVFGEEPLLGYEGLAADLDAKSRANVKVAYPVRVGAPRGEDDGFLGRFVEPQDHGDRLVGRACLAAG